jgi:hypothetical protein
MKTIIKSLFFDRALMRSFKKQKLDENYLQTYLLDGKISMEEYLYLCRQ